MTRSAFLEWLEARLLERGVLVRRWQSGPALTDVAIRVGDRRVRLRTVRTGPR